MSEYRRSAIYNDIDRERDYQDRKYGAEHNSHQSVPGYLLIMEEELREAKYAWMKGDNNEMALLEILQVAAVAVACMEFHGSASIQQRMKRWEQSRKELHDRELREADGNRPTSYPPLKED